MKITKSRLKQIIREELDNVAEAWKPAFDEDDPRTWPDPGNVDPWPEDRKLKSDIDATAGDDEDHYDNWPDPGGVDPPEGRDDDEGDRPQLKLTIKETLPARPYDDPDRMYGPRYPGSSEEAVLWLDGLLEKDGKTQFLDHGDRDTLLGISHWLKGLADMVSENEDAKEDAEDKPVIALKLKSKINPMLSLSVQRRLRARERLKGRSGYRYEPPEDNQS